MLLQPLCQGKRIVRVPLRPQTKSFQTLQEKKCAEGVEGWAYVTQNLGADFDCECNGAKGFAVFHAVVALARLGETWELSAAGPVEFTYPTGRTRVGKRAQVNV